MTTTPISTAKAARLFVDRIKARAFNGTVTATTSILSKGPPGRKPRQEMVELHNWYAALDVEDGKQVQTLIRYVAESAVFGCLALLDGVTLSGDLLEGEISDFALYLQVYTDGDAQVANAPSLAIRINHDYAAHDELHDMLVTD